MNTTFYIIRNGGTGASDTVVQHNGYYSAVLRELDGRRVYRSWRGAEQHRTWSGVRDGNGLYAPVKAVKACSLEHALEIALRHADLTGADPDGGVDAHKVAHEDQP